MKSIADIKAIRDKMQAQIVLRDNQDAEQETRIVVGMATCGISAGARPVFKVTYVHIDPDKARNIIASHIVNGNICTEYMITKG